MSDPRPEIAETYDLFGPQFWNDLAEATRDARRHLNTLYRNWSTMDALTRNSLMGQVHVLTTIDIYERIKSICEPRGHLDDFEWDIAFGVKEAETDSKSPQYHSQIITLYYWLLARYFYWLDRLGVLFRVAPPNLFASDILEEMSREVLGSRKKRRSALTDVLTELPLPPPPPPDDHAQEVEDEFDLEDELDSEPGEQS